MKLTQTDEESLAALGIEAASMLSRGEYSALAHRFGYALSFGREPAAAIEADHLKALASPLEVSCSQPIEVKYFKPNDTGLFALVECIVQTGSGMAVLLELIVTGHETKYITIEDISGVLS